MLTPGREVQAERPGRVSKPKRLVQTLVSAAFGIMSDETGPPNEVRDVVGQSTTGEPESADSWEWD